MFIKYLSRYLLPTITFTTHNITNFLVGKNQEIQTNRELRTNKSKKQTKRHLPQRQVVKSKPSSTKHEAQTQNAYATQFPRHLADASSVYPNFPNAPGSGVCGGRGTKDGMSRTRERGVFSRETGGDWGRERRHVLILAVHVIDFPRPGVSPPLYDI